MGRTYFLRGITCVFGQPVAENPTEVLIKAGFLSLGLDWRYLTLEVAPQDLREAVMGARAMGFKGFHCTIPHKVSVVAHLDRLAPSARLIGAVNCVVRKGDELIGENTDGQGFLRSLPKPPKGKNVVILGAGGAARAIAVELALAGASRVTIVNRDAARGKALAALLNDLRNGHVESSFTSDYAPWVGDCRIPEGTDLLVNATSIGLFPDVDAHVPISEDCLKPGLLVCDVIPNPPNTHLLRIAAARGCEVLDGLDMLVMQGVIGMELWTGKRPDAAAMKNALHAVFNA